MTKKFYSVREELLKGLKEIIEPENPLDKVFLCVYDDYIHSNDEISFICLNCGSRICNTCYENFKAISMTKCPTCDIEFSDYYQVLSILQDYSKYSPTK